MLLSLQAEVSDGQDDADDGEVHPPFGGTGRREDCSAPGREDEGGQAALQDAPHVSYSIDFVPF